MTPMFWNNLLEHIKFAQQEMTPEDYYYYMLGVHAVFSTGHLKQKDTIATLVKVAEMAMVQMNRKQAS